MGPPDHDARTFDITPAAEVGPLVFASPHSGDGRPDDFGLAPGLSSSSLRSAEDALVERLVASGPARGAPLIAGRISRAYVDLNRAPDELDPDLIDDCPPGSGTARTAAGYGVAPRLTGDGRPLYDRRLTLAEAQGRIGRVHAPYHAALSGLMNQARAAHGRAVLIDWHSMPARAAGARGRTRGVDVVLGDRHGTACDAALTRRLRGLFEGQGLKVALNRPYAGGYSTQVWGRPAEGFHAVQIEINRALYFDEAALRPNVGYGRCRSLLERVIADLCADPPV